MSRNRIGLLLVSVLLCGGHLGMATPAAYAISAGIADVWADASKSVYVTGWIDDTLGGHTSDAIIARYDASGNLQWLRQFGTAGLDDSGNSVSADVLGNVHVAGGTYSNLFGQGAGQWDAYVATYDSSGELQQGVQFGTAGDNWGLGVSADGLGNFYVAGDWAVTGVPFEPVEAYVRKYDAVGNLQWTRQLGTPKYNLSTRGISRDAAGNVLISGIWGKGGGNYVGFVAKYDSEGDLQWLNQPAPGGINSVSTDDLGNVYIAGSAQGEAFVVRYDAGGNLQWTKSLGSSRSDRFYDVSADDMGNVYLTGTTHGDLFQPNLDPDRADAIIVKYDSAGNLQWGRQLSVTSAVVHGDAVSADGLGNVYLSGSISGKLWGGAWGWNGMVVKYDADGNFQWMSQLGDNVFVPEPGGVLLAVIAIAPLLWIRRRRT